MALEVLDCPNNKLTKLSITGCATLQSLNCSKNQLTVETLNKLFESLPTIVGVITHASLFDPIDGFDSNINISDNPGESACDRSIATNKGWVFGR